MTFQKRRKHTSSETDSSFFDSLRKELPPVFPRKDIPKYLGNLLSVGYMANLDSQGRGPKAKRLGGQIAYERESFLEWFIAREEE